MEENKNPNGETTEKKKLFCIYNGVKISTKILNFIIIGGVLAMIIALIVYVTTTF